MEKLLTKTDVCDFLNVSPNTLDRIVKDGLLPVYRIRGQCRFMQSDIDSYISGCREIHPVLIQNSKRNRKSERSLNVPPRYVPGMKVV